MIGITDKQIEICEALGWKVSELDDGTIELHTWSPADEDLYFYIYNDETFKDGCLRLWDEFDVDEHVELWIDGRGKNGIPGSIKALVEDAEAIEQMLEKLWRCLEHETTINPFEKYAGEAGLLCNAIRAFAEKPDNLDNFEGYLSLHFNSWMNKWAHTPRGLADEFMSFAEMDCSI